MALFIEAKLRLKLDDMKYESTHHCNSIWGEQFSRSEYGKVGNVGKNINAGDQRQGNVDCPWQVLVRALKEEGQVKVKVKEGQVKMKEKEGQVKVKEKEGQVKVKVN